MLINSSNVRSKNGLSRTQWTSFYLDGETKAPGRDTEIKTSATAFRAASEQVTFWSEPLKEEAEITGPAAARLFVESSTTDADIFVTLRAFVPNDREVLFRSR